MLIHPCAKVSSCYLWERSGGFQLTSTSFHAEVGLSGYVGYHGDGIQGQRGKITTDRLFMITVHVYNVTSFIIHANSIYLVLIP